MLFCSKLVGALIWTLLQSPPSVSPHELSTDNSARVTEAMHALEHAHDLCDWQGLIARAADVRQIAQRGSDAWFEACAREVAAQNEIWAPEAIERVARDALDALAELRKAKPDVHRSALGPLHPRAAGLVLGLEIILAHVLQSRGMHAEALGHLRLVLDDLAAGPCLGAEELTPEAGLDSARSLLLLGRAADARIALTSLRDNFPGSRPAASASVLLQSGADGLSAYRGKYQGDPEQAQRMRTLLAALPRARSRVAARLGWPVETLPNIPVGFVDLPSDRREMGALTEGDPRRPAILPVVLVFNETLALDMLDMETLLVHELTHAVLMHACGPAYHRLPLWMVEGLSEAVAEQTAANMDNWLANRLSVDARGFASPQFWKLNPLVFDAGPCARTSSPEAGLAILPLVEAKGIDGVRQLVAQFKAGRSMDEALKAVLDMPVADYLALARDHVQAALEKQRQDALITAHHMSVADEGGPAAVLQCAEDAIHARVTRIALGFALWKRADALGKLGRFEESFAAHRALHDARREYPNYVEVALMGEAGALVNLGKPAEAASALRALQRDAMTPGVATWAAEQAARMK